MVMRKARDSPIHAGMQTTVVGLQIKGSLSRVFLDDRTMTHSVGSNDYR